MKKNNKFKKVEKIVFNKKNGFGALFIVIILGSLSLALVLALSSSSFLMVKSATDIKNSYQAKALVSACAETTLEIIRENNNYLGSGSVALGGYNCNYTVTDSGGTNRSIDISATINNITQKLQIITNAFNPLGISSWKEV
jgi:hypothetical protein